MVTSLITAQDVLDRAHVQEPVPAAEPQTSEGVYVLCRTLCLSGLPAVTWCGWSPPSDRGMRPQDGVRRQHRRRTACRTAPSASTAVPVTTDAGGRLTASTTHPSSPTTGTARGSRRCSRVSVSAAAFVTA